MKKKALSILLCLLLLAGLFAGCSSKDTQTSTEPSAPAASEADNTPAETTELESEPEEISDSTEPEESTDASETTNTESDPVESEEPVEAAADSIVGQTITFRNLDITFNSMDFVKAAGQVLALNVTIVNNGDEATCVGAARTTLLDGDGEKKSQYGFDVDDMVYVLDTEVAPGETITGYFIYYAPKTSPATLTLDNSFENDGEIIELVIAF